MAGRGSPDCDWRPDLASRRKDDEADVQAEDEASPTMSPVQGGRFGRFASLTGAGLGISTAVLGRRLLSAVTFASKDKREAALSRTLTKEGHQLAELLGRMKGASMKLGQMLSADPDLVPPELSNALATLQTESPPMPWATVRSILERAWGMPIASVLASIDETPRGSASIGQVHRATLSDGQVVAIKVQYPGVEAALGNDLKNLRSLMTLSRVVFDKRRVEGWLGEVEEQLLAEVDYVAEAANLTGFGRVFEAFPDFVVPRPIDLLTRRNVLVMTWLDGDKLDRAALARPLEERRMIAERMARTWIELFFRHRWLHGDPHPGNFLLLPDGRIGVLDFGATKRLPEALTDGVMELFAHLWADDARAALKLMGELGFGDREAAGKVDPALLGEYLRLVLAPLLAEGAFDYGAWRPHAAIKRMTIRHPSLWKLAPPKDLLPVLRVASGLKGLFGKLGVALDLREILQETRALMRRV